MSIAAAPKAVFDQTLEQAGATVTQQTNGAALAKLAGAGAGRGGAGGRTLVMSPRLLSGLSASPKTKKPARLAPGGLSAEVA